MVDYRTCQLIMFYFTLFPKKFSYSCDDDMHTSIRNSITDNKDFMKFSHGDTITFDER